MDLVPKRYKRRSNGHGSSDEHVMIVEQILGKKLPTTVVIHHIDGNRLNNSKDNLVVCQDQAYHKLLHTRTKALDACGNANWRKCWVCKKYCDKTELINKVAKTNQNGEGTWMHRTCEQAYMKNYHIERKA